MEDGAPGRGPRAARRRAAAHLRRLGGDRAGGVRRLVPRDPRPGSVDVARADAAALRYYRQFDELSPEEVSRELLERRDEERRRHPVGLPPLDLSGAAWHGPPHAEVINAATFALRRAVNAYPDASRLRAAIAASHGIDPARVTVGHGAGELIRAALRAVATDAVEIVWPGWGLLPQLVDEAGATPVPVVAPSGERTAVVCRPERPDRRRPESPAGEHWLIVDEALAGFADEPACSTTRG